MENRKNPVNIQDMLYRSHAHYDIGRNFTKKNGNEKNKEELKWLYGFFDSENNEKEIADLSVALHYALYKLRN